MGVTEAGLIVSGVVALVTGYLTHLRSTRAHRDTVVIDQQTLVNETYELVLVQVRAELSRKDEAHSRERDVWHAKEERLQARVQELEDELAQVKTELQSLRDREPRRE